MDRPNLFSYATSELSQDAMICWLIAWADRNNASINPDLNRIGERLLNAMLDKHGVQPRHGMKVDVKQQIEGLDILALVDGDLAVLIEDKIHSSQHSNQLDKYTAGILGGIQIDVFCRSMQRPALSRVIKR